METMDMYVKVPQLLIPSKGEVWELFDDENTKKTKVLKALEKKHVDTLKTLLIYLERQSSKCWLVQKIFSILFNLENW